jgi:hypothetical protein
MAARSAGRPRAGAAALAAALLALVAPPRAEAASCRLPIAIEPTVLDADHPRARIQVTTMGPTPRLVASAGEIRDLRRSGPVTFSADYVPPREGAPRAAVVGAILDSGACGIGALEIAGAEAPAEGQGGGGPVAVAFAPPFLEPDRDGEIVAYVFAADGAGKLRAGEPPALEAEVGAISEAEPLGGGAWRARWRLPARGEKAAILGVSFRDGTASSAMLSGPAAILEVKFDRRRVVPGDTEPVGVTVTAWDAARKPTDADLLVSSEAGDLSEPRRLAQGVYGLRLSMPAGLRGSGAINVQARAGEVLGEARLAFAPGEPASLVIGGPEVVPGDGSSTRLLSIDVSDAHGNPVDDVEPAVEAGGAIVGTPSRVGPGNWMVAYRPRRVGSETEDVVVARAGSASSQRAVHLVVPSNRFSAGPKVGVGLQAGGASIAGGAEAAAWTVLARQQVGLVLEATYWSLSSSGTLEGLGGASYRNQRGYFPLTLSAAWRRPLRDRLMLWGTLGGGVARVTSTNQVSVQQDVSDAAWAPVASAAVSVGLWAWNGFPFVELRGTWVGDPKLPTLSGPARALLLQVGYRFHAD